MEKVLEASELSDWLRQRCQAEGLSYRQVAARAKVSHTTISTILKGKRPSATTLVKLAKAFSGEGQNQKGMLEDYLLVLGGYRSKRPEVALKEPLARVLDKLSQFDEAELGVVEHFVDFFATLGNGAKSWKGPDH